MATSSNSKASILQPQSSKSSSSSSKSNQNSNSSISTSTSSYSSIYVNPLTNLSPTNDDKENVGPAVVDPAMGCVGFKKKKQKEQQSAAAAAAAAANLESAADSTSGSSPKEAKPLKPPSLQLCMKLDDYSKWDPIATSSSSDVWDFSDSEAAPASSWSALPNRSSFSPVFTFPSVLTH